MNSKILIAAFIACTLSLSSAAFAANGDAAPKGWLLIRSGVANSTGNYDKEDADINGKLEGVSVLCQGVSETPTNIANLIASDTTRVWGPNRGIGTVSTVVNLKGNVVIDALKGNPNHCLINGLTLSQIKGIWH
jgi:hypothetical protein